MRKAFVDTLLELAEHDPNLYLLVGDLGFAVFEGFIEKFPQRFINCGVAEQNMMGVAAGLALSGKKVYVYSIVPFLTMRCFEQIRNDIAHPGLDVKIIGYGAGFSYGALGATHHAIEDIAIFRALPNMTVLCPADPVEAKALTIKSYQTKNPTYFRMGKGGDAMLHKPDDNLVISEPFIFQEGEDGAIITTGSHLKIGLAVVKRLKEIGFNFKLISMHTLKPVNKKALVDEIKDMKLVVTLEEHNVIGGLGSLVAEVAADYSLNNLTIKRMGIEDEYVNTIGDQDYLREYCKIDENNVYQKIVKELNRDGCKIIS